MKHEEAMAFVNEIESAVPVGHWCSHGVPLWPMIRCRLIRAAFDQSVGSGQAGAGYSGQVGRRAAAALRATTRVTRNLPRSRLLRSPSDAIVVTDGVAVTRIDGVAHDVVGDPVARLVRSAGATVNTWYTTYACPDNRATEGALIQWRLDAAQIGALCSRRRVGSADLSGYDRFLATVRNVGLPERVVALERIHLLALRVAAMAKRFESWLAAASPRLVFVNCYYSLEGGALMLACARLGILSVDVQHGVQGEKHVAYGSWVKFPSTGYDVMPDRFWCWSPREAAAITSWAERQTARHRPLVGGNPWLEFWQQDGASFVRQAVEAARALVRVNARTVLVTLQWGLADQVFLIPLIKLMRAAGNAWTWWVRLHPVMRPRREELRERLREAGSENVLLDGPSDHPLPALLKHADVHLTYSSSTALEAAAMGVPSVLTSPSGAAYYPDLVHDGTALVADSTDAETLLQALLTMATRRGRAGSDAANRGPAAMRALLAEANARNAAARRL